MSGHQGLVRMESVLEDRERYGVPDAILLEDYQNEAVFIDNLKKRYHENVIYTYIGQVLVSVNPYKDLGLYTDAFLEKYRNVNFYEVPPHVFAITENAYRTMTSEVTDHCILISGYFIGEHKYLFHLGDPVGGHILNYLLEKSRVVHQELGERNFHVFYQLLAGAPEDLMAKLDLTRDPNGYFYLKQGDSSHVGAINDRGSFEAVDYALDILNFSTEEQEAIWGVIASILHLGNVTFSEDDNRNARVSDEDHVRKCSKLIGCEPSKLMKALTHRTIEARGDIVTSPLNPDQAGYARDALAKSVYERVFNWLVGRLNTSLAAKEIGRKTLLGILDIYGFEIFDRNGFEQFCINYCNEKLQQVFIELTLKSEQEEYKREGIEWEPVKFFDNKIICDLVEEKHKGIISLLDEECLRPGDATDLTFLNKMDSHLSKHDHYFSYETAVNNKVKKIKSNVTNVEKVKKTINKDEFRLRHYAGEVAYRVQGFLDKNNDLLFRDLKETMSQASNVILKSVFPREEVLNKKRPETAATQFKQSLANLMDILMIKEPSYIRCIKPNDEKRSCNFNIERVSHQVKYLGLMENLRVRRAGFAYRRLYEIFLGRYKSLCPATWPKYPGNAKDGVKAIVDHLGYHPDDYRMGETKLFIRLPKTLFFTEDRFQMRKAELATMIQAKWKAFMYQRRYQKMRDAVTRIAKHWRRIKAQRVLARRKWAVGIVRAFIKGFITRNEPVNPINERFQQLVKCEFLLRLSKNLPKNVLDTKWPPSPAPCNETSNILHGMYRTYMARRYVKALTPEKRSMFEEKVLAEQLFKGQKASYMDSLPQWFMTSRLTPVDESLRKTAFEDIIKTPGEKTKYCIPCTKYDRHGYKPRDRLLILTSGALYLLEAKENKLKQKHRFSLKEVQGLHVSPNTDNLLLVQIPVENAKRDKSDGDSNPKGDLILNVPNVIEAVTKIISISDNAEVLKVAETDCIGHTMKNGKQGTILLGKGNNITTIDKNKEGKLAVIAGH
ncbi:unconventional myosin IC-like [Penaeus japonicus]|uniref:unconventional myosin IC-like n=1 Tax=Penaeus japonicus TaxID=27405 RepID=UPI001C70B848|nr:unconventional myosin IC-like [Penaeus japonicus]